MRWARQTLRARPGIVGLFLLATLAGGCGSRLGGRGDRAGAGPGDGGRDAGVGGDAGRGGDGGAGGDGGSLDAGGDAGCAGCGVCTSGETRCDGPRLATCDALGRWSEAQRCDDGLCRAGRCVPVSSCAGETPPCCALPADCGALHWRFSCPECRPIDVEGDCLAGVCVARTTATVDFVLRASAAELDPVRRAAIHSAVLTLYRGMSADGRRVTCPLLLSGAHDRRDEALNVVHSRAFNYQSGTGNDLYDARLRAIPAEPDQSLVLTVYDGYDGEGAAVARACAAGVNLRDGGLVIVDLQALP